jgi:hypothetical protein
MPLLYQIVAIMAVLASVPAAMFATPAATPGSAKLFVVDAARQHPFTPVGPPLASGLALVEPDPGMLIAFNASPGSIAPIEKGLLAAVATPLGGVWRYRRAREEMARQALAQFEDENYIVPIDATIRRDEDIPVEAIGRTAAAGRLVLVGTRSVAASERISRCLAERGLPHTVLNARQDRDEAEIVALAGQPQRITVATNMAGRGTDIRLADGIPELGGLHVIVTEYHESRRIDRQLIGRGARQGDPGSWEAIISMEDALFTLHVPWLLRVFGRGRMRMKPDFLRVVAQLVAERKHARERRAVLRVERNAAKQLAFAGGTA